MSEYRALYRKWRPTDFDDVCGQDRITDILKYEVEVGKISHAYLFCGSRGTGKTSCAKILAKAVNCERPRNGNPCNECEACRSIDAGIATDVIEMDAASNNGVDNVRSLKDEISFTPALLKYRVYIIDEVHMMSGAAFNALLKTLEEPPAYVVFILATTEFNKLPTTIVSRCQRFDFRRISSDVIVDRLMHISREEGIELADDGARLIARASRGGLRDAVSLLELCAGSKRLIDAPFVAETIGTADRESAYSLISAIARSDYATVYSIIREIVMGSGDISVFWQELIDSYRDIMVVKNTDKAKAYLDLTEGEYERVKGIAEEFTMARLTYHTTVLEAALGDMQRAVNSKRSIAEIALTRMCNARLMTTPEALAVRVEELEKQLSMIRMGVPVTPTAQAPAPTPAQERERQEEPKAPAAHEQTAVAKSAPEAKQQNAGVYSAWGAVLERIAEIKKPLSSQFVGAVAHRTGEYSFVIKMNRFFADRLKSSAQDSAIVRGAIAEAEGVSPDKVTVSFEPREEGGGVGVRSDLDKI
ncbi:MAG: DNA polymerase III subunit gamma/tau [Clostridia bacterium]|nr:DNA polymerase III subunit gamma/tau [Clostridia bacterium]